MKKKSIIKLSNNSSFAILIVVILKFRNPIFRNSKLKNSHNLLTKKNLKISKKYQFWKIRKNWSVKIGRKKFVLK